MSKYPKYAGLQTSDEVLDAIIRITGVCIEREKQIENETEQERGDRLDTCNCEFCRVWANPTDAEIEAVEKQLQPGTYYWGVETVVIK
jgi:hypothetical protein